MTLSKGRARSDKTGMAAYVSFRDMLDSIALVPDRIGAPSGKDAGTP